MDFKAQFWLMLLPVILLAVLLLFLANAKGRGELIRRFAAEKLVRDLLASYSPARQKLKRALVLLGLVALLIALARPIIGYDWRETKSKGIDILFVLDSSRSMLARDIKPNRLERAKLAIVDFVDRLEGDRVGLVAFAGEAFLQCPLTLDYNAFEQSLNAVNTSVISTGGTDIARAIIEAESAFKDDKNYKILVLITDGEDLEADGIEQARRAAEKGVTIYTVGVGTTQGEVIPVMGPGGRIDYLRDSDGNLVKTKLDEDTLTQIAEVTDGFYVPLGPTGYGLEQVYEAGLASIPKEELSAQMERFGIERFQWPLGVAIVLLAWEPLIGTRRRFQRKAGSSATLVTVFMLGMSLIALSSAKLGAQQPATRDERSPAAEVREKPEPASPPLPADPRALYNEGNRQYAAGNFAAAAQAWQRALVTPDLALQADAFYNLGNARYRQGAAALADKPDPAELEQADRQAYSAADAARRTGNSILERATTNQIPVALRNQQAQEQAVPQQEIQQAIQIAEQAKTSAMEAKKNDTEAKGVFASTRQHWEQALKDYQSAAELSLVSGDAVHNAKVVQRKLAQVTESLDSRDEAIKRHQRNTENLEKLIEELEKLLEEQQDDQNQDQQNQDQQQNQDESQDKNQQGDRGEQDSQQDNQNQEQQGDQQNQGQEGDQQNQGEQSEGSERNGQDQPGGQKGEQPEDRKGQEEQSDEARQGQEPEQQEGEQPSPGETEQSREEGAGEQPMKLSEEDAQKAAEMAAAQAGEQGQEGEENGMTAGHQEVQLGVMSREQARRFLDSMKDEEKKLPVSGYGPLKYRKDEEGKRKDW